MAYPTQSAALALDRIDQEMVNLHTRFADAVATLAAGSVTSEFILNLHNDARYYHELLNELKTTPGIVAHARAVKDDPTLDVVTEFNAVQTNLLVVRDWIEANMPQSAGRWLNHIEFVNHVPVFNEFTPAATAALRTELTELVNLIAV